MAELSSRKIRKSNFSPEEIEVLVNTVFKHYNILYGEFAKRAINKHARHRVWLDVTKQVNRVSVERRTLQEVKNKWKKCQHLYREQEKSLIPEEFVVPKPNVWEPLCAIKDSMPLEQRLSKTSSDEPVLQSQPLSPTKLKVTRQAAKPPQPSPKPPTPDPPNEEVCLRWNSHHSNMQSTFPNLLLREQYVDATLVAEGQTLKCHRLILSSCSPYFEEVLSGISPFQHPVLFMKDVPFWILKSLCDFMYAGEVHIFQNKLEELLAVAETLKIKGLAGKQDGTSEEVKPAEPAKAVKDEKKDEKEGKDRKKHTQVTQQRDETAATKSSSKSARSTYAAKRNEKANKELPKTDDILDPLDLLEPVYEELTKESKQTATPAKCKDNKATPVRRSLPKKIKKRKLSDEREESPPPLFLSRKGTRSRPNVKIPKFYHPTYDRVSKSMESPESTIVREPHTDQADPLMHVDDIKAEPLDLEDNVIEIEDSIVGFSSQEMPMQEEELIEDYDDSPIVNPNDNEPPDESKEDESDGFKKISLMQQPVIMDVHSIAEKTPETLKVVNLASLQSPTETPVDKDDDLLEPESLMSDMERPKAPDDPLNVNIDAHVEKTTSDITITNVETLADHEANLETLPDNEIDVETPGEEKTNSLAEEKESDKPDFHIEDVVGGQEDNVEGRSHSEPEVGAGDVVSEKESTVNDENGCELGFHIAKVASEQIAANEESKCDRKDVISEDCSSELGFQITNVVSGHFDGNDDDEEAEIPANAAVAAETVVNNSSETVDEAVKDVVVESNSETLGDINVSDETRLIAESLEELLEK